MFESYYGIEKMAFEHGERLRGDRGRSGNRVRSSKRMNPVSIISLLLISGCAITPLMMMFIRSRI